MTWSIEWDQCLKELSAFSFVLQYRRSLRDTLYFPFSSALLNILERVPGSIVIIIGCIWTKDTITLYAKLEDCFWTRSERPLRDSHLFLAVNVSMMLLDTRSIMETNLEPGYFDCVPLKQVQRGHHMQRTLCTASGAYYVPFYVPRNATQWGLASSNVQNWMRRVFLKSMMRLVCDWSQSRAKSSGTFFVLKGGFFKRRFF